MVSSQTILDDVFRFAEKYKKKHGVKVGSAQNIRQQLKKGVRTPTYASKGGSIGKKNKKR